LFYFYVGYLTTLSVDIDNMSTAIRVQLVFQGGGWQSEYLLTDLAFEPSRTIFADRFGAFRIQHFSKNNLNFDSHIWHISFF
jgi:hypothetical protein